MQHDGLPGKEIIAVNQAAAQVPRGPDEERGGEEYEMEQQTAVAAAGIDLGDHGSACGGAAAESAKPAVKAEQRGRTGAVAAEVGMEPAEGRGKRRPGCAEQYAEADRGPGVGDAPPQAPQVASRRGQEQRYREVDGRDVKPP